MKRDLFFSAIILCTLFFISGMPDISAQDIDTTAELSGRSQSLGLFIGEIVLILLFSLGLYKWWIKRGARSKSDREPIKLELIDNYIHGIIDYLIVFIFGLSPVLFGFGDAASNIAYVSSGFILLLTILTQYRMGVIGLIPMRLHGIIELLLPPVLILSPWVFNFSGNILERNFFVAMGLVVYVVHMLSMYNRR